MGGGGKLTPFIFLWASTKIQVIYLYQSPFRHPCYSLLSLETPDTLGFLLKYLICYFSPHSIFCCQPQRLYLCISDLFDPFFLVLQPPDLATLLFQPLLQHQRSPFFRIAQLPISACTLCAFTSFSPSSALNWYLVLSRMSHSLLPCLFLHLLHCF